MKKLIVLLSVAAFLGFAVSCSSRIQETQQKSEMGSGSSGIYYTCTMHPEVHLDKAGRCPKCGMELVKKEISISDSTDMHMDTDSLHS